MKSKFFRAARFVAPLAFATVVACGSDSVTAPPGSNLVTETERAELEATLSDPDFLYALSGESTDGSQALILSLMSSNMRSIGSIDIAAPQAVSNAIPGVRQNTIPVRRLALGAPQGSYKAFAGQVVLRVTEEDSTETLVWTGVLAMNQLSNPTDIIIFGVASEGGANIPTSIPTLGFGNDNSGDNDETNASYIHINSEGVATTYEATSGSVTISSASFSGGRNCTFAGFESLSGGYDYEGIELISCRVSDGAVKGTFSFTAAAIGGDSQITIPATSFNIPGSRTILSVKITELD